jgi:hypothetical protein
VICANPTSDRHDIGPDDRRISVVKVDWGKADLREKWAGEYVFCCFLCLADWAQQKAAQHDGVVLIEGRTPDE